VHQIRVALLALLVAACGSPAAAPTPAAKPTPAVQPTTVATATRTAAATTAPAAAPSAAPSPKPTAGASAPAPSASPGAAGGPVTVRLERAWTGFARPLGVVHAGDGSGRLFVLEQGGLIKVVANNQVLGQPFLDLRTSVSDLASPNSERGLLGMAVHPGYRENGLFFVHYTDKQGNTQLVRFKVSADPNVADPDSAKSILSQRQPFANHNGGQVTFGPDGFLYMGLGDGGSANDPQGNGQNLGTWLGKILRLDVDGGDPYAVPPDNPFRDRAGAKPEIWAYGLRNPWRFSFDRVSGDLWIGDVGQNAWEEIDYQLGDSRGGENYGWNVLEGAHCRAAAACDQTGLVPPVAEYGRQEGCSVTGGFVYRGSAQAPGLRGVYTFGDYCSGRVWGLSRTPDGGWQRTQLLQAAGVQVSSFGEDESGEIFVTSLSEGVIYHLLGQ
jgi:glucose/arabinose dehydrogenase